MGNFDNLAMFGVVPLTAFKDKRATLGVMPQIRSKNFMLGATVATKDQVDMAVV